MGLRGRSTLQNQTYFFVTSTVKNWEPIFDTAEKLCQLRDIIYRAIVGRQGRLIAYVLMPNHFHLVVHLEGGGPRLSDVLRDIKSLSSRLLFPERHGIWIPRFDDVVLFSDDQFRIKLAYIHNNPVRAKLVAHAEDYDFSSAGEWLTGIASKYVDPTI